MRNPNWYEDPPEDPPEEDLPEQDLNWGPPDHAPFNDPDYQAEQDRRHDRK
jgi:hypothetical protein